MALVAHVNSASGTGDSHVSAAIDTTGATSIALSVRANAPSVITPSDSKGNTWVQHPDGWVRNGSGGRYVTMYRADNPTVGTGHTFTFTDSGTHFSSANVQAHNGVAAISPLDVYNSAATASASTKQPGPVTPSANGSTIISTVFWDSTSTLSIDSGFTSTDDTTDNNGSWQNYGGGMAYLVQGTAATVNPTWTDGGGGATLGGALIMVLKPAASSPSASGALVPGVFTLGGQVGEVTASGALTPGAFTFAATANVSGGPASASGTLCPGAFSLSATAVAQGATGALVPAAFTFGATAQVVGASGALTLGAFSFAATATLPGGVITNATAGTPTATPLYNAGIPTAAPVYSAGIPTAVAI